MDQTTTLQVDDNEMKEIAAFEKDIKKGMEDVEKGRYKIVETGGGSLGTACAVGITSIRAC